MALSGLSLVSCITGVRATKSKKTQRTGIPIVLDHSRACPLFGSRQNEHEHKQ